MLEGYEQMAELALQLQAREWSMWPTVGP